MTLPIRTATLCDDRRIRLPGITPAGARRDPARRRAGVRRRACRARSGWSRKPGPPTPTCWPRRARAPVRAWCWWPRPTSGRGRMGRRWISPPRRALHLLGPAAARRAGRPAGLGAAAGRGRGRVGPGADGRGRRPLKWPNDVLVDGAKIAGILAERWGSAVVIGTGINVLQQRGELPVPHRDLAARRPGGGRGGGGRAGGGAGGGAGGDVGGGRAAGAGTAGGYAGAAAHRRAGRAGPLVPRLAGPPRPGDADRCGLRGSTCAAAAPWARR